MTRADLKETERDLNSHLIFCDSPEDCPEVKLFVHAIQDIKADLRWAHGS